MSREQAGNIYALLDSRNTTLARGRLESPRNAEVWQVLVLDDKISDVLEHHQIQLIPLGDSSPALLGKIIRSRNDSIVLQKMQKLSSDLRRNLRMATDFESFIYPLSDHWKGRREIQSNDLSCGGIAFYCMEEMRVGERIEVVIPITSQPLIVRCEILRRTTAPSGETFYASKFVDMCHDEEMVIREAVFSVQVKKRTRSKGTT